MMNVPAAYDLSPVLHLLLLGAALAAVPLTWVWWRKRQDTPRVRLQALVLLTLFLTFDLVLFGAFTRLTDSGLGCPDWPGCYGSASPVGAHGEIAAAQAQMPSGPVTHHKAWIEMVHRYLATGVGALITAIVALSVWLRRKGESDVALGLPVLTLVWVCLQGAFGALTVTMKLFPAIVTLHLLGGYGLLALLTVQAVRGQNAGTADAQSLRPLLLLACAMLLLQALSGAWVSTNYAVLACADFPQCHGSWWPTMDFSQALSLWRPLGYLPDGTALGAAGITAIHFLHRLLALCTVSLLGWTAWRLQAAGLRRAGRALAALLALQVLTGISNVVLGWPLLAALLHTGGAGALLVVLVGTLAATRPAAQGLSAPWALKGAR